MVNYNEIRSQLRQKQTELAGQRVHMNKRMLRTGIQGLPQRKQIGRFNRQLREQHIRYDEQIKDVDRFLLTQEKQKKIKIRSNRKGKPTPQVNPEPSITMFNKPTLKKLRNRWRRGGSWF